MLRARLASQLKLAFIKHFVPGGALGTVHSHVREILVSLLRVPTREVLEPCPTH